MHLRFNDSLAGLNFSYQPGDVIEQVNRQAVRSEGDLKSAISRAGSQPLLLLINRRGASAYVTVRFEK